MRQDAGQTPVLERPAGSYVCSVARDRTSYSPKTWTGLAALQPVADGSLYLARVESIVDPSDYSWSRSFLVSSVALDGSLGSPVTVPVSNAGAVESLATARRGDGFELAWADPEGLHMAAFDAAGALVGEPGIISALEQNAGWLSRLQMAADPSGSGFALALSMQKEAYALFLDAEGVARGPMRRLGLPRSGSASYSDALPYVTASADGYAFVWMDIDATSGRVYFSKADTLGNQTVAPHALIDTESLYLGGTGFAEGGARIIEVGGEFVVAWSETYQGKPEEGGTLLALDKGAWSVVRLTRLDSLGAPTGLSATMRAPEVDVDEVEPVLTRFGETLAVSWGHGTHIYACGGCVPDDRMDFVLIDPVSFTPLSNVVTITNGGGRQAGGLLRKQVTAAGSSFLMLYDLQFHTSASPGSAVLTCTQ